MLEQKIKKLRETQNLSRKQMAKILDCSFSHMINIEKGAARLTEENAEILIKKFKLSKQYFGDYKSQKPVAPSEFNIMIGRNVLHYRKKFNMLQDELSEELGYAHPSTISAIERGQRSMSKEKLIKCADLFGIHVAELLNVTEAPLSKDKDDLVNNFLFLVESKEKPVVYEAIKKLISDGCEEIRSR